MRLSTLLSVAALGLCVAGTASARTLHDEAHDGDLSDNAIVPTDLGKLRIGSNLISARFNKAQPDFFTITVPPGLVLDALRLKSWDAKPFEDIAFMAVTRGTAYTATVPGPTTADGIFGWSHLRSTQVGKEDFLFEFAVSDVPSDEAGLDDVFRAEARNAYGFLDDEAEIETLREALRNLGSRWAPGAEGFDTPLGPGSYSFWLRQGSDTVIGVDLDFVARAADPTELAANATIAVSKRSNRSYPAPLQGARVSGHIYVFVEPLHLEGEADRARFYIDGNLARTEYRAPFDLGGTYSGGRHAAAFNTRHLSRGWHQLVVEIELLNGHVIHRAADFYVH